MSWMLHHWLLICVFIVLVFLSLAGTAALEAYLDFKGRPKEPMMWCTKHGYFRKVHALPLFPEMGGSAENSFICPMCYYKTVFKETKQRMN